TEGDELLVAGDSTGQVLALDRSGQSQWSAQVEGEIRHDLLALDEGRAVVVPDTTGLLHLLAAAGSELRRYATEAPLAADPGTSTIDDAELLLVYYRTTLHAFYADTGLLIWRSE